MAGTVSPSRTTKARGRGRCCHTANSTASASGASRTSAPATSLALKRPRVAPARSVNRRGSRVVEIGKVEHFAARPVRSHQPQQRQAQAGERQQHCGRPQVGMRQAARQAPEEENADEAARQLGQALRRVARYPIGDGQQDEQKRNDGVERAAQAQGPAQQQAAGNEDKQKQRRRGQERSRDTQAEGTAGQASSASHGSRSLSQAAARSPLLFVQDHRSLTLTWPSIRPFNDYGHPHGVYST